MTGLGVRNVVLECQHFHKGVFGNHPHLQKVGSKTSAENYLALESITQDLFVNKALFNQQLAQVLLHPSDLLIHQ